MSLYIVINKRHRSYYNTQVSIVVKKSDFLGLQPMKRSTLYIVFLLDFNLITVYSDGWVNVSLSATIFVTRLLKKNRVLMYFFPYIPITILFQFITLTLDHVNIRIRIIILWFYLCNDLKSLYILLITYNLLT